MPAHPAGGTNYNKHDQGGIVQVLINLSQQANEIVP